MEENKTKELINVFSNTYELIRQAAHILDHESMTKVCQHDEDFQNVHIQDNTQNPRMFHILYAKDLTARCNNSAH